MLCKRIKIDEDCLQKWCDIIIRGGNFAQLFSKTWTHLKLESLGWPFFTWIRIWPNLQIQKVNGTNLGWTAYNNPIRTWITIYFFSRSINSKWYDLNAKQEDANPCSHLRFLTDKFWFFHIFQSVEVLIFQWVCNLGCGFSILET